MCLCVFCNVWVFWIMCTIGVLVMICVLLCTIRCTCVYMCSVLSVIGLRYFFYIYLIFYLACMPPGENSVAIKKKIIIIVIIWSPKSVWTIVRIDKSLGTCRKFDSNSSDVHDMFLSLLWQHCLNWFRYTLSCRHGSIKKFVCLNERWLNES